MVVGVIVLGHKISSKRIKVDRAKIESDWEVTNSD